MTSPTYRAAHGHPQGVAPSLVSISHVCQILSRIKTRASALTNLLFRSKVVPCKGMWSDNDNEVDCLTSLMAR
jgi:hypothetical protein